jgi:hypothetical protein
MAIDQALSRRWSADRRARRFLLDRLKNPAAQQQPEL